ncbi:MAG: NAD(P)H-binding protein [Deltaproteobacteria bacterium]|nr:NAD(P)H-binding protein [Deltaproteobacteria bacterium]
MLNVFVAGATSFTGRAIAHQNEAAHQVHLRLQVRPSSKNDAALGEDKRIVRVDLDDHAELCTAMEGCEAVFQLIGTVKARFADDGDYEQVDYGTTQKLLAAAKKAGVRHFILLSSVGAGIGLGRYLTWKKKTEQLVADSGLAYTLVRPSYLAGDEDFPERSEFINGQAFMTGLSDTPFGAAFATLRPMPIQDLAQAFLHLVNAGSQKILSGTPLFRFIKNAKLQNIKLQCDDGTNAK